MRDWILGYQRNVANARPGVTAEEWQRFSAEVTEAPPEDLRALYSAFNGGEFPGGVTLFPYAQVVSNRSAEDEFAWMFGEHEGQHLLAARKATLAAHPDLTARPEWFERTSADDLTFAEHDAQTGTLRVYPSLQQLLSTVAPPIEMDSFGDLTLARAMRVVEEAIDKVSKKVAPALSRKAKARKTPKKAVRKTAKRKAAKKRPVKKSRAKSRPARKKSRR